MTLGQRALKTGKDVAEKVISGQNITQAAKRRVKQAGIYWIGSLLSGGGLPGVRQPPQGRIKRTPKSRAVSAPKRRRKDWVVHIQWVEHRPTASLSTGVPIEFLITGSGNDYLDLASTYLYVRGKVKKADGTDLDTDNPVEPVNSWLHTLFSPVDVSLNGMLVKPSTNTYA